ncbi:MAG TPA: extracellular solute-binding protein, partial [Thermomicrobiales bacterium]|nr:extracellular solute-binding protein [Thermomicrobiales bacterium]
MKRSARRGIAVAVGMATALALFGCTSTTGGGSAPAEDKTITLMNWEALAGSPYEAVFKQFTADTGIKIEYQFSASGSNYWPKTRTVLGSNNPPDIMRIDDDFLAAYAATGRLQNLNSYMKKSKVKTSDYYDSVLNNTKQPDGSTVGWSLGIQPRVIYYNKTMFQKAGLKLPPTTWSDEGWTWDDFLADAKALSVSGQQWGADIIDDSGFEMIYPVNNGGTGRWSKNGKSFTLADKKDAEAVQCVADLTCKYGVQPAWSDLLQNGRGQELFAS